MPVTAEITGVLTDLGSQLGNSDAVNQFLEITADVLTVFAMKALIWAASSALALIITLVTESAVCMVPLATTTSPAVSVAVEADRVPVATFRRLSTDVVD